MAVFGDAHAHAEALDAVLGAAEAFGVDELWSLGDMIGRGPDPEHVVARTRESCAVALMGNHDYGATGAAEPTRFGEPGSPAARSIELARERLGDAEVQWMRSRRPAARRGEVQCWHGGPRNAVHEYVGASNAGACLAVDRPGRSVRIALGSVAPTIVRAPDAEAFAASVVGWDTGTVGDDAVARFASLVAAATRPIDDHRASAAYRRRAVEVLAGRLLRRAFPRTGAAP